MRGSRDELHRAGRQVVRAVWLALSMVVAGAVVRALSASPIAGSVYVLMALVLFIGLCAAGIVLLARAIQPRRDIGT